MTNNSRKPRDPTDMEDPLYNAAEDPTSPFYVGNKLDDEQPPHLVDKDGHKVGPGRPPKKYTWKKGGPSPWPAGRPKKVPSMKPDLKKALEDALNEKVVITKDKKEVVLTKAALGIQQLVNQFAKGDRHARRDVFQYASVLGVDLHAKQAIEEALGLDAQAIIDDYVRRRSLTSTEPSEVVRVKAPPDLLDDDAPKSETSEEPATRPPASPSRAAKMPIEPVFDEKGVELPITDVRYIRTQNARELEWDKKRAEES